MPFKDILGHDREIGILSSAISNNRVAHSFLFVGPEGVGKRLTAISIAKSLNCSGAKGDFCGVCRNCVDIESSSYADVFLVEPRESDSKGGGIDHATGTIKIGAVRDVQQRLSYKAVKGGKKVCIVDGVEKMNRDAQNAFLKTLEEPPSDSIIILIACDGAFLLPTIVSRCHRINFRPLPGEAVVKVLMERQGMEQNTALLVSSLSGGSIGKALESDIETTLKQRKKIIEMMAHLSVKDVEGLFEAAEEIVRGDMSLESLEVLKIWYRDMAVFKEGGEDVVINHDLLPVLKEHSERKTFERLMDGLMAVHHAQIDIMPPRYANKQLVVENLLMQLAR